MTTPAINDATLLRMYLGDRVPTGGTDADAFFTDNEITAILSMFDGDINQCSLAGWSMKMAEYARLIDIDESGSQRKLSQRYRAAAAQVQFWQTQVDNAQAVITASARITGRTINMRRREHLKFIEAPDEPDVLWTPTYNRFRTRST